ncbi:MULTISPECIES: hypothetical protein [unclassified Streptomyces]
MLALLAPGLMMAFLFGMDALEDRLVPRPVPVDDGEGSPVPEHVPPPLV